MACVDSGGVCDHASWDLHRTAQDMMYLHMRLWAWKMSSLPMGNLGGRSFVEATPFPVLVLSHLGLTNDQPALGKVPTNRDR